MGTAVATAAVPLKSQPPTTAATEAATAAATLAATAAATLAAMRQWPSRKSKSTTAVTVVVTAVARPLWTEVVTADATAAVLKSRPITDVMEVVIRDADRKITDATAVAIADVKNKRLH